MSRTVNKFQNSTEISRTCIRFHSSKSLNYILHILNYNITLDLSFYLNNNIIYIYYILSIFFIIIIYPARCKQKLAYATDSRRALRCLKLLFLPIFFLLLIPSRSALGPPLEVGAPPRAACCFLYTFFFNSSVYFLFPTLSTNHFL